MKKQNSGPGQFAVVTVEVVPLERGAGVRFANAAKGGSVPQAYLAAGGRSPCPRGERFRVRCGDLPPGSTLEEYEDLIAEVVRAGSASVYLDPDDLRSGGALVIIANLGARGQWLVKVHGDSTIRTAFPPSSPGDAYVKDQGYDYVGKVRDLQS